MSIAAITARAPIALSKLKNFGSNPGHLRAKFYVPEGLGPDAALVVALHGSQQSAEDYADGAGWAHFANQHGFALLLPEQRRSNNPMLSFNWFEKRDNRRAHGEALSIRKMISALVDLHELDAKNVFVTGLSSGGAMAIVMMATYPEVFAGGAVIAGLPYGCASGAFQAIDRMHGLGGRTEASMEATIRGASAHDGPWPTLSLWQGSADKTVSADNVEAILGQWRALHGLSCTSPTNDVVEGYPRRVWCGSDGRELVEAYSITGMGHGTPIETIGQDGAGVSGAYMLDAHISSTRHIARFWGLAPLTPILVDAIFPANATDHSIDAALPGPAAIAVTAAGSSGSKNGAKPTTKGQTSSDLPESPFLEALQVQIDLTARLMVASAQWWWPFGAPGAVDVNEGASSQGTAGQTSVSHDVRSDEP